MSKELDELILNCDHDVIVEIGETTEATTNEQFGGKPHFYLNCLVCSVVLIRDESFYKGYKYSGIDLGDGPMYHRIDYKNY